MRLKTFERFFSRSVKIDTPLYDKIEYVDFDNFNKSHTNIELTKDESKILKKYDRYDLDIYKFDDEWFTVIIYNGRSYTTYKCDTFKGLLQCLNSEKINKVK